MMWNRRQFLSRLPMLPILVFVPDDGSIEIPTFNDREIVTAEKLNAALRAAAGLRRQRDGDDPLI